MEKRLGAQARLKKDVLEQGLCTGCGACSGLCPYQVVYQDRIVQYFPCDLADGKCRAFCPRTWTDYDAVRRKLFDVADLTPEIGPVRGFYLTRSADSALRRHAQHGATVTSLLELAMKEGLINAALVSAKKNDLEQEGRVVEDRSELRRFAKSRFTVSPTVAAFHRHACDGSRKIGIVATPCQAAALAKIKTAAIDGDSRAESIGMVIGLFCGWTLSQEKFQHLLQQYRVSPADVTGVDIPSGKNMLELHTTETVFNVPFADVEACIRTACRFCIDSTAELADLSVGAARYGGDWQEMREWNQVIVRSRAGEALIDLARQKGVLEIRQAPAHALEDLKKAAAEKKKKALANLVKKSGSKRKLFYLSSDDPVIKKYME
jgi:coenzyme F420 hydrogenase subunit beta